MTAIAVPILLVVGALLAVQAAANVQMSTTMRSPLGAATLQLGLAAALLLLAATMAGSVVGVDALSAVPAWHLLGGLGSAVYITAGILLLPRLGAVVTVGSFIAGQMLASLVLDSAGLLGADRADRDRDRARSARRVRRRRPDRARPDPRRGGPHRGHSRRGRSPAWPGGADLAGPAPPVARRLVRGRSGRRRGPSRPGGDQRVAACGPRPAARGGRDLVPGGDRRDGRRARRGCGPARPHHSWADSVRCPGGWLGALVGAGYVTAVFLLLPQVGAAPTIALTVAGQQLAGLAVDQYGLLRLPRRPVSAPRLLGIAVLLVGVGLLQLRGRDRSSRHLACIEFRCASSNSSGVRPAALAAVSSIWRINRSTIAAGTNQPSSAYEMSSRATSSPTGPG